jgi:hypothetical protein
MNIHYRNATLAKARESPFLKAKKSAATLARAADSKLRLDLAGLFTCSPC